MKTRSRDNVMNAPGKKPNALITPIISGASILINTECPNTNHAIILQRIL